MDLDLNIVNDDLSNINDLHVQPDSNVQKDTMLLPKIKKTTSTTIKLCRPLPSTGLKRYVKSKNLSSSCVFEVPLSKIEKIKNIISQCLGINCKPNSEFKSMVDTKKYFVRKMIVFENQISIMRFKYPDACSSHRDMRYVPNNDINISYCRTSPAATSEDRGFYLALIYVLLY